MRTKEKKLNVAMTLSWSELDYLVTALETRLNFDEGLKDDADEDDYIWLTEINNDMKKMSALQDKILDAMVNADDYD